MLKQLCRIIVAGCAVGTDVSPHSRHSSHALATVTAYEVEVGEKPIRRVKAHVDEALARRVKGFGDDKAPIRSSKAPVHGPSAAQMLCSAAEVPKLAICLHGGARTFPHALIHTTQKGNLVDALGLPDNAAATLFLHVTQMDSRGEDRTGFNGLIPGWTSEQIQGAARKLGIRQENQRIIGAPDMPPPDCKSANTSMVQSLTGQLSHRYGCSGLIEEEERRRGGSKFDSILLLRADLVVYQPFRPFCSYQTNQPYRKHDWLFWFPRNYLQTAIKQPYEDYYTCKKLVGSAPAERYEDPYLDAFTDNYDFPVWVVRLPKPNMPHPGGFKLSGGAVGRGMGDLFDNPFNKFDETLNNLA